MSFQPSEYSGDFDFSSFTKTGTDTSSGGGFLSNLFSKKGGEGDGGAAAAGIAQAAGGAFNLVSTIIGSKAAKTQAASSMALAGKQAELEQIRLQAQQAQIEANKYAAMAAGAGTQKLVYIVGGMVLLGGMGALTVVLLKRNQG
jgi:hypothetical protein